MNTIPTLLRSRSTNLQDQLRCELNVIAAPHAKLLPSNMDIDENTSATEVIDGPDNIANSDQRAEGLAEYTAQDAVDIGDGEESDNTREVLILQRAARRHILRHVEEDSADALTIGRQRLFKLCKATANAVHVKYQKIYLGPVPHLLLCLEWIIHHARGSKNAIKAQRAKATTLQELSDLRTQHKEMR